MGGVHPWDDCPARGVRKTFVCIVFFVCYFSLPSTIKHQTITYENNSEIMSFEKLQISCVIPWKGLSVQRFLRVQKPLKMQTLKAQTVATVNAIVAIQAMKKQPVDGEERCRDLLIDHSVSRWSRRRDFRAPSSEKDR